MNEEEIFLAATEMPAAERLAYLATACDGQPALRHRVERLLASHDHVAFMRGSANREDSAELKAGLAHLKPEEGEDRIGTYRLLHKMGEGGFGTVWMAEQLEPVRRPVALKILKLGMDTREVILRFEQERQALALMEHPNIAKVFDGGATSTGRPFFVMELVRGVRITDYCDQNDLSPTERIGLFMQVCHAIQHAHQKGVVHRDIKPSNILVALQDGVPVPKVIDFGIAKATTGQRLTDATLFTAFEQFLGTPAYMSPEQAETSGLDIDTRSDIYSLGVLLYELLTGKTPFDAQQLVALGIEAMRKTIREKEPMRPSARLTQELVASGVCPRPSSSVREIPSSAEVSGASHRRVRLEEQITRLRGDLDWIIMKCLEKDRSRRYHAANDLASDLRRHLNNELVVARPPSTAYRFQKAFHRNKLIFVASGAVALAMLLALIVLTFGIVRISKERNLKDLALRDRGAALAEAKDQLFLALLNQARANRFSGRMGQRFDSLETLTKAAQIRPDERLRDEAITAMALTDLRRGPSWPRDPDSVVDGSYRLSANADAQGIISVRSVPDRREVVRIESGHPASLLSLSVDGRFVAHVDNEKTLRVWRVADGQTVLSTLPEMCSAVAFSRDGQHLCVGQENRILRFDLETGQEINRWLVAGHVHSLAFHPDNHQLAVGYEAPAITSVYDVTEGGRVVDLRVNSIGEQVVAWHPDGQRLAVGGDDPRIQIWDVPAKTKLSTLEGHVQRVTGLGFHPDGELLASQGWEGVTRLWHPSSGRQLMQIPRTFDPFAFSEDGRWLGGSGYRDKGHLLEVATCPEYRTLFNSLGAGSGQYFDGDISPDGRVLALAMGDGVRLWNLANGLEIAFLPTGRTFSAIFQPDGRELLTSGKSGLCRWPFVEGRREGSTLFRLGPGLNIPVPLIPNRAARSRDGRILAVVSEDTGGAVLVNLETGSVEGPLKQHQVAGLLALSPDGHWLATSGWHSKRAKLWNVRSGEMVREWIRGAQVSTWFTPDSQTLIISGFDGFSFWDVESLQEARPSLPSDTGQLGPVAFSPDGKLMAVIRLPGIIHLQEAATDRTVARLEDPHGDRTTWMKFTPDGTQLVAASNYSQAIHVWDLRAIRVRLKNMGLDWDWPEIPPASTPVTPERYAEPRLKIEVNSTLSTTP